MRFALFAAVLGAALVLGCSDGGDEATPAPQGSVPSATSTAATDDGDALVLEAAFGGRVFDRPTEAGVYDARRFFVVDQGGLVSLVNADGSDGGTLLDARDEVLTRGSEQGLLSLALDPQFPTRPYLYIYYSAASPNRTVLSRLEVRDDKADPASELVVLSVPDPYPNHNGGAIRFGPDGMLYLGIGDGGGSRDPDNSSQDLAKLLGKVVRIDVRNASEAQPYLVPSDNPFVSQAGARPEIWAYGFRNPWRMAFDGATGKLWVGDVGEQRIEEIDVVERGGNYGWDRLEGNDCLQGSNCDRDGTIAPLATYTHDDGCSVTGGVVYRGSSVPALSGMYLYGDYCSGSIWALPAAGGTPRNVAGPSDERAITSFAVDEAGEVYVVAQGAPLMRVVGLR